MRSFAVLIATLVLALAAVSTAEAVSMKLTGTTVDRTGMLLADKWSVPDAAGTVTWTTENWTGTYVFAMPESIPAAGAPVTLTVTAESRKNAFGKDTNFAPDMAIRGSIVTPSGRVDAFAHSDSATKPTDTMSATATLTPTTGTTTVTVGMLDGPTYTFTYEAAADNCPGGRRARAAQAGCPPPPIVSTSTVPEIGKTTAYAAPAPGAAAVFPMPKPGSRTIFSGTIDFVDANGALIPGPSEVAIAAHSADAVSLCYMLLISDKESSEDNLSEYGSAYPKFAACLLAVSRILARADEIKAAKARPTAVQAQAAQRACGVGAVIPSRRSRVKPKLRVTCTPTATGMRVTVRPRSSKQTLRQATSGRPLKLIVGRSTLGTTAAPGDRLTMRWT